MFFRKRMYPTAIQATFPGVNGVNTIVIGQAELTADKTSTRWVLTVLHEHFHQLVYSQPGYCADVEKLGLAHGDKTGMWMLNYPFPYDSARVQEKFTAMTHALLDALTQTDQRAPRPTLITSSEGYGTTLADSIRGSPRPSSILLIFGSSIEIQRSKSIDTFPISRPIVPVRCSCISDGLPS